MRYLSRKKIYEKVSSDKDAKKVYIFCEGEKTEIRYFNFFKGFSSNIDIIPIPSEDGKTDPEKLKEKANLLFFGDENNKAKLKIVPEYNDEIWFVIDTDKWNEGNKIENLKSFCSAKNQESECWFVAQSNPCFEVWLYYHFFDTRPETEKIKICSSFKEFVHKEIPGGFDHRSMPIELKSAITNSEKNYTSENDQPKVYSTQVHRLGKVILEFVGSQLDRYIPK